MTLNLVYFILFIVMGLLVSYEDWKSRKIRNRLILIGLGICGAGYLYLFVNSVMGHWKLRFIGLGEYWLPLRFYPYLAVHFALAASAGLLTWWIRLWPAGDAKFYIVSALFLTLIEQNIVGFPGLVFLRLLINIFVPAGLWILATVALGALIALPRLRFSDLRRETVALVERTWIRAKDIWPYRYGFAVYLTNIFLLLTALEFLENRFVALAVFKGPLGQLMILLVICVLWKPFSWVLSGKGFMKAWGALGLWWYFDPVLRAQNLGEMMYGSFIHMLMFGVLYAVFRSVVTLFLRKESEETIDAKRLKPGMILSEEAWDAVEEAAESEDAVPERYPDGLFPEDIETLRSWTQLPDLMVSVYRATPFAVWVFTGALLTLTFRKNAVFWLFAFCSHPRDVLFNLYRLAWGS